MAAPAVTPGPGLVSVVTTGGTAVTAVGPSPNGGFITNPATATSTLFVNPVGTAGTTASGTTFGLAPGQSWSLIPGQTTPTSVNSTDSNHKFSVVVY
jgi:hypothetical protein